MQKVNNPMVETLKLALNEIIPKGTVNEQEIDSLAQICMMGTLPSGTEDPKLIMKSVSTDTLNKLVNSIKDISKNQIFGKVSQFFIIEWGHRNGHIDEWKWSWDTPNEGRVSYRPNISLNQIIERAHKN